MDEWIILSKIEFNLKKKNFVEHDELHDSPLPEHPCFQQYMYKVNENIFDKRNHLKCFHY